MTVMFLGKDITNEDTNPIADLISRRLPLFNFTEECSKRGIYVVQDNDIVTDDMKSDFSRFFPQTENNLVIGGSFQ